MNKSFAEELRGTFDAIASPLLVVDSSATCEPVKSRLLVSSVPLQAGKVLPSFDDASELLTLGNIVPICCSCRAVKLESDGWQKVDAHRYAELRFRFSHGICPKCRETLYPDFA